MIPTVYKLEEAKTDTISVFDIDDTLLFSKSKVYVKKPGEKWIGVDTATFAEEKSKYPEGTEFNLKDFIDYDRVLISIVNGVPNLKVLKQLTKAVIDGHKIGIVTARGSQKAIWDSLSRFLLYRDKHGELQPLPVNQFNKRYVFAVGDPNTSKALGLSGKINNPAKAKAWILQKIFADKMGFSNVVFYDDDKENIEAVKDLNDSRIHAIKV